MLVAIKTLDHFDKSFHLPRYQTMGSAGADLQASLPHKGELVIHPGERILVPTGLAMSVPQGMEVQIRPRSGLSLKTSLMVLNSPGTIDSDYRGEIKILIGNLGSQPVTISHGDRVAQMVLCPVTQAQFELVQELDQTERNAGGFGSTGVKHHGPISC
jgi:dUTP pyrophosphatase